MSHTVQIYKPASALSIVTYAALAGTCCSLAFCNWLSGDEILNFSKDRAFSAMAFWAAVLSSIIYLELRRMLNRPFLTAFIAGTLGAFGVVSIMISSPYYELYNSFYAESLNFNLSYADAFLFSVIYGGLPALLLMRISTPFWSRNFIDQSQI